MKSSYPNYVLTTAGWLLLSVITLFHASVTWSEIGPDLQILGGRSDHLSAFICDPTGYLAFALPELALLVLGWWMIFDALRAHTFLVGRAVLILGSWILLTVYRILPFGLTIADIWWKFGNLKARLLQTCLTWC